MPRWYNIHVPHFSNRDWVSKGIPGQVSFSSINGNYLKALGQLIVRNPPCGFWKWVATGQKAPHPRRDWGDFLPPFLLYFLQ